MPDPVETLNATQELAKDGFIILPYCHADPVLCKKLEDAGAAAVPLGSAIGSNRGLDSREFIRIIIEQASLPVIIDAGVGKSPRTPLRAMEMGASAVLVNTALAVSNAPMRIAAAFRDAVRAGRSLFSWYGI